MVEELDVTAAQERLKNQNVCLIDVRSAGEYADCHAVGAANLPLHELPLRFREIPRDRHVLVICQSGHRSMLAVKTLRAFGFSNVINVQGGTVAWQAAGLPIEHS
jgi:rhodanese-related sulfurtransferase